MILLKFFQICAVLHKDYIILWQTRLKLVYLIFYHRESTA